MPQENHHHGQRLRAGIIGCGAIGSLLDEDDLTLALSHAGACAATPGVELTAICDTSEERLQRCGDVRQVQQQYVSFQEMLGSEKLDLVSICTPVSQRLEIIEAAVNAQVKVIICEKPLASSTSEGQAIAELINGSQTELVLNFQRRWDAGIQEAAQLVRSGEIGDIHRGFAIYEKGLAHNGSHLIDLMNLLLGPPSGLRAIPDSTMQPADQATPTFDAEFRYDNNDRTALVYVSSLDHSRYSIFELQLLGTLGRIVLSNGGQDVTVYKVVEDSTYAGYKALSPARQLHTTFGEHLKLVMQTAADIANGTTEPSPCGLKEGLENLALVDRLLKSHASQDPASMEHGP